MVGVGDQLELSAGQFAVNGAPEDVPTAAGLVIDDVVAVRAEAVVVAAVELSAAWGSRSGRRLWKRVVALVIGRGTRWRASRGVW